MDDSDEHIMPRLGGLKRVTSNTMRHEVQLGRQSPIAFKLVAVLSAASRRPLHSSRLPAMTAKSAPCLKHRRGRGEAPARRTVNCGGRSRTEEIPCPAEARSGPRDV